MARPLVTGGDVKPLSQTLLDFWMRWRWRTLEGVPRPTDSPFASTRGTPTLECVALGNGPISGWGVATHQLGLVGALARALSRETGRGVTVRGALDAGFTVRTMRHAEGLPWAIAQLGIISYGPLEILTSQSVRAWQRDLHALIADVRTRLPAGSTLVVLGIPPITALPFLRGIGATILGRHIVRYNDHAAAVCAAFEGVQFVPLPDPGPLREGHYRTAEQYAVWADVIAASVTFGVAVTAPVRPSEEERARSVARLGLLQGTDGRFDRIVRLARRVFHTEWAAFAVLHDHWEWNVARAGALRKRRPRHQSISEIVVAQAEPVVIGDTWADDRFDTNDYVRAGGGVRFYAGYPLRAPDGNLIGTLSVFDSAPRDPDDIDIATLRDFALMIEKKLVDPRN